MRSLQEKLHSRADTSTTFSKVGALVVLRQSSLLNDGTNGGINKMVRTYFCRPATSYAEDRASEQCKASLKPDECDSVCTARVLLLAYFRSETFHIPGGCWSRAPKD